MRWIVALIMCLVGVGSIVTTGCSKSESEETSVMPLESYREEAEKSITAENADAELKSITEEIEKDQ